MAIRHKDRTVTSSMPLKSLTARAAPLLLVLLAVTLMAINKVGSLPIEGLRTAVTDVMAPVLSTISKPFTAAADSFDGVRTIRQLKAENIRLAEENVRLMQWYEQALKMQAENQSYRDLLNVKADPDLTFVTTRVVSDPGGAFVKSVLLPVGKNGAVKKGNAVMSGKGLIGRVTEAGKHSSRVLLVTDLNSRIPVIVQNTRTKAILAGQNEDLMRLERLPIDSGLAVGQRIVTSGDGGQLPPDIPVGTIVSIGKEGIAVKPLADIKTLTYVQVVNAEIDGSFVTGEIAP